MLLFSIAPREPLTQEFNNAGTLNATVSEPKHPTSEGDGTRFLLDFT
jgi:hypothetical protein